MNKIIKLSQLFCLGLGLFVFWIAGKQGTGWAAETEQRTLFSIAEKGYSYVLGSDWSEELRGQNGGALEGAGKFRLFRDNQELIPSEDIHAYSAEILSSNSVKVLYTDASSSIEMVNIYTFHENSIQVDAVLTKASQITQADTILYVPAFIGDCSRIDKRVASRWNFPDNGNYPYREFDSMVDIYQMDNQQLLYSFRVGDTANSEFLFEYYPDKGMVIEERTLPIENHFVLVFESDTPDSDMRALFEKNNEELGIKIERADGKKHTMFQGEQVSLQIKVVNVSSQAAELGISYQIYDYYGNAVTDKELSDQMGIGDERVIPLEINKNSPPGIYWLDLKANYLGKQYRELYPFAVLQPHTYTHSHTSPFGVSGVRFGRYEQNGTILDLASILGVANMRVCLTIPDYLEKSDELLVENLRALKAQGVRVLGQILLDDAWNLPTSEAGSYELARETLKKTAPYLYAVELGNENNSGDSAAVGREAEIYKRNQFDGELAAAKEYGLKIASSGVRDSRMPWIMQMRDLGILRQTDILSTHAYSWNMAPERRVGGTGYLECLEETRKFLDSLESPLLWYMSEFGVHTAAVNNQFLFSGVNPRIQADFLMREYALGLAYGADALMCYNLIDGSNLLKNIRFDYAEDNWGMFYKEDYYDRIMPKPAAVAFANLTRNLETVQAAELPDINGTIYTVKCVLADGRFVTMAWSAKEFANSEVESRFRLPSALWENKWTETETLYWQTNAASVETEDIMGTRITYPVVNGVAQIPLHGSPIYIY